MAGVNLTAVTRVSTLCLATGMKARISFPVVHARALRAVLSERLA